MNPSVMTTPGLTEFTRILRGPNSFARDFVIASTAALLAAETEEPAGATVLTREPIFTTLPPFQERAAVQPVLLAADQER